MNSIFRGVLPLMFSTGVIACTGGAPDQEPIAYPAKQDRSDREKSESPTLVASVMALDGEGLRLVNRDTGSTSLLSFGASRAAVERVIAKHLGAAEGRSSNDECGAGAMDFTSYGDFGANFQDDRFVGWSLRDGDRNADLATMSGVGIGSSRSEMAKSVTFDIYEDSTIGTEFHVGGDNMAGFSGLFESEEPDAPITDLWAGANCIFR